VDETADPFPLGVASFDPLARAVLLWTRVAGAGSCAWEVATDPDLETVVRRGEAVATDTGIVTVDVDGLEAATRYWYRFTTPDGQSSRVGRTRTLPEGDASSLTLGVACCARFGQSEFGVYGALAGADVDVVVHLGDYIYEDEKFDIAERAPRPDHPCVTLDDYRTRHDQARRDPDAQDLHAAHPVVVVWDDHDLADNAWRGGAKAHDPEHQGPWPDRLAAALRAHQEYLPKRLADPADLTTAWRRLDGGDLVSIVCTEGRAHRDEPAGHDGVPPADHPDRTLLGPAQARWLEECVVGATSRWIVVLSGTVVSELVIPAPAALDGVLPEKYAVVDDQATNTDQWDGYHAERDRLAAALARRSGGSLVLSGDIHSAWAIEGPLGPDGVPVAVELVCPPAATTPLGQLFPPGVGALMAPGLADQIPGARWVDVDHRGYLTVAVGRDRADATWWWVDPASRHRGDDASPDDPPADPELGRRWSIPRVAPMALVDPEPRRPEPSEPAASPLSERRRRRRQRAVAVVGALVAAGGVVVRRRRRS
jgi:alkaline phosphatase D